ncbi:Uncharacterised protein [Serratia quinivorans]|nr:Uncharacterised protein [Serratia quinivorans]
MLSIIILLLCILTGVAFYKHYRRISARKMIVKRRH